MHATEHIHRINPPMNFVRGSLRRKAGRRDGRPYSVILGQLPDHEPLVVQGYRFPVSDWTPDQVEQTLRRTHSWSNGVFEAAGVRKKTGDEEQRRACTDFRLDFANPPPGQTRADGDKAPVLRGHAAVFNKTSDLIFGFFREKIAPGAFSESIANGDDVRALVEHQGGLQTLGRSTAGTLRLSEDDVGLAFEIDIPNTTAGNDVVELINRGDLHQMSFGFRVLDDRVETIDGEEVVTLLRVELLDVSVVAFPAYPQTGVSVRSLTAFLERDENVPLVDGATPEDLNEPYMRLLDLKARREDALDAVNQRT